MEDSQDLKSRIKTYIEQDNFQEALNLSRTNSEKKGNEQFKYYVGFSHKLLGQLEEAINIFEDFEEEQFKNLDFKMKQELLFHMADIYYTKELFAKSAEYFNRLLELNENYGESQNKDIFSKCISSYLNTQNLLKAQKIGQGACKKYPDDANINLNYAKALIKLKKYQDSIKLLDQFIQRSQNAQAKLLLSDTYFRANMLKEAENINQQILSQHQEMKQEAIANLVKIKFSSFEFKEAFSYIQLGFSLNPNSPIYNYYYGMNLYLQGSIQQAIPQLEMAITLNDHQNHRFILSFLIAYIDKGYLTQDYDNFHISEAYLKSDDHTKQQKQINNNLKDNPLLQYVYALILRLNNQPKEFQQHWSQIFHINQSNQNQFTRHPSQDIYESLDQDSLNLLRLIQQIDFCNTVKAVNSKYEAEIESQKTLLLFQILKFISIPSARLQKQKQIELIQLIRNINKYQEICSEKYQSNQSIQDMPFSIQSQIFDQSIVLNNNNSNSNLSVQEQKQKKDKGIEEFQLKFLEITNNVINFANQFFKKGFKLNDKISNFNAQELIIIIILSTIELEDLKSMQNLTIDDLNLPSKVRRIMDLNSIGGGFLFSNLLQSALEDIEQKKIKSKLSKKELLKQELQSLNAYKLNEDLFVYKSSSEALAYEYAYKFFTTLLLENQAEIRYYSYITYYYQTISSQEQTDILKQIFNSVEQYSHKSMKESFIKIQSDKCLCNIF
ncbi:tetratricopeptide repeat protein (macronuclear) [Tetrahymena thermophila SB210]|uniref:Tetratricopeptide repeat protein n=1 Tax=Tetrahymena thermophila (strain SB210) TaxID=312017 RepID=Q22KM0_TETTS|nr:tetratricopeptide repeat protein [Tetrahymena thermophila SB210]EAR85779.2 tetratricopeptide repeat protein [Tetrahymena thermophila SB210]|eukprot:XP_001033442.2 tetratricopeptide repeat protein [Tetrahymena thermophila SB210]